ncbi:MAG: HutD family protein, partial [Oscillospiraceae bacterium]|nr:HutD family protein [Oscillospiraceae bacterium]
LEESDFTPLPGVERYITPISGGFTLTHPGKSAVVMGPMDPPYHFSGGEDTHCVGRATDFNLMCKGVAGEMTVCSGKTAIRPGFNSFYALEEATFLLDGCYRMAPGQMLVVFADTAAAIELGDAPVICCWAEI